VGRLKRAREDFPDDDVILIPPRPGLSSEWRLIPRELLEKWKKAITALEKFWEANQAFEEAKKTGNESEYLKAFLRARRLGIEASEGIENYGEAIKCFCYCRVCIKIIKLKNNKKLSSPPTDKDAKDIVKKANQLFNKCRIKMIIEQIEAIEISDDEFTRFIEVGVNQTLDSPAMIRELSKRKPNPLSNSCFNIFLLSKKNGHLGKHPTISGTVSGFSTGKDGVLKSPATGTDPIPTHAVVNKYFGTEATARTLAHEMGHILCLKGYFALHYDKLDRTIFRETVTLNEEQRKGLTPMERHRKVNKLERQRAFDKASKFLEEMEKLISEERLKNKELSEEEAKSKVRKALSPDDQKRFDIVYNLMVLGSSLSPKDCVEMCKCIKKTYPSMCEG
jgi:hypothetical protein